MKERGRYLGANLREQSQLILLLALIAVLSIINPHFRTIGNLVNLLRQISVIAIISCGMTLVLLSGCLPSAKFNTSATPLVKGLPGDGAGTPIVRLTPIPTGTPFPLDPLAPIVPHSWPPPLTYDTPPTPASTESNHVH